MNRKVKVLIVDDTVLYRKILRDTLETFPEIEIVGTAPNGKIAVSKIKQFKPDVLTLDLEMPELNGLDTLRIMRDMEEKPNAIMVSAHTTKDAGVTMQALNLGAFDFITKPEGSDIKTNIEMLKTQFEPILKAFLSKQGIVFNQGISAEKKEIPTLDNGPHTFKRISTNFRPKIVAIGISTGGPKALAEVIPALGSDIRQPIVIVQHMPPVFTKALADSLNQKSKLTVQEAMHNQELDSGYVYIAPGGKQMKIEQKDGNSKPKFIINDDPPENFCKPAVDYLFRSVAKVFPGKSLAVIMTGMGRDGVLGLRLMKRTGCAVIAQDKESSVVYGMPAEAVKAGVVDFQAPLKEISIEINRICRGY